MRTPLLFKIQDTIKTNAPIDFKLQITIQIFTQQFECRTINDEKLGKIPYLLANNSCFKKGSIL
ncbi:hypothetical protein FBFR_08180 [Flavobacterium fryxellicola]|uniref:Uncharacterized protein n=1 Tax=Flavobacterium fryxellicola TaxID=249352 RepID=A0A167XSL4_9FLAO|nr:hypothetical protein FBFR_08180 [Flavobacterium fryxellicola]